MKTKIKATTTVPDGKPDAENPLVRFDEGKVASYPPTAGRPEGVATRGAKPRRGSLLYIDCRQTGLGCNNCGPIPLPQYRFAVEKTEWMLTLQPILK